MEIKYMQDVTEFIEASMHEVVKTLFEALLLVFLVVYIFLQDFRSTLIPMIAVPVSLVGTFFFLTLFGFSLNLLTLSALVLAIGHSARDTFQMLHDKGLEMETVNSVHGSFSFRAGACQQLYRQG